MCSTCSYARSAHFPERICRIRYSSCCIYHIIDEYAVLAFDISDDVHDLALVRLRSSLVNYSDRSIERLRHISCSRNASVVRRNDYHVVHVFFHEMFSQYRHAYKVIHRDVEVALYLSCMQIHSQHSVCTCRHQKVCNQLCCDRISGLCFSVLSRISVVRDNCIDPSCRCALHCIYHDKKLHEIVVYRIACRLYYIAVNASYRFPQINRYLSVTEFVYSSSSKRFSHY